MNLIKLVKLVKSPLFNQNYSLLSVQLKSGLDHNQIRANIKLAISGGQNEPRDALAGTGWALLSNPNQLEMIKKSQYSWVDGFEEY